MQHTQSETGICCYPGCTQVSLVTCRKCHQGFCMKHVHRQWKKYICEFCFLVEKAQGSLQKKTKRIAYLICALLAVSGILLFALGYSNELGLTFLLGGFFGMAGVATSSNRMVGRPTRASDIDANIERRAFGYRDSE